MKSWSNIFDSPSTAIKKIGLICYHLRSFRTTTPSKIQQNKRLSLRTMVTIQGLINSNFLLQKNPTVEDLATRLLEIQKDMKIELLEAQERQKRNADKSRKQHPPICVGDKVWLLRRNLKTHRPSDKLDYRRLDPFLIIKRVNEVAYRLELPPFMKIHPVFHIFLLEPYKDSTIPKRLQAPPPPIEVDGTEEFEVSEILDSCINRGKLEYLVHWQGYEVHECTWELAAILENAPEMIAEFHREYPSKPKNV